MEFLTADIETLGAIGYAINAFATLALGVWLVFKWRGRVSGGGLVAVCVMTALWSLMLAWDLSQHVLVTISGLVFEQLRFGAWAYFLVRLIAPKASALRHAHPSVRASAALSWLLPLAGIFSVVAADYWAAVFGVSRVFNVFALIVVMQSIASMVLLEYYYRTTRAEGRWGIKFLLIAGVAVFGFDLAMYATALLFQQVDPAWWVARGFVESFAVPLLFVTAKRNPDWSVKGRVPISTAYYSSVLILCGAYLIALSAVGYYLRVYGGVFGVVLRNVVFSGALIVLALALFSGTLRARLRVFLSKRFFDYKYDYRDEWLRFIQTLASGDSDTPITERSVRALANLMDCSAGMLWERRESGVFEPVYTLDMAIAPSKVEDAQGSLASFLENWQWVIDITEWRGNPSHYQGLDCPDWLADLPDVWLVVPLLHQAQLTGFIVLGKPRVKPHFGWEDIDLLKTAGRQIAIHLAEAQSALGLAKARQFEAYHKLSAYVMHDLKNLVAQLSLVVSNAKKHAHNPEFMKDASVTLDNAVGRMNRLLSQLRASATPPPVTVPTIKTLQKVIKNVLNGVQGRKPIPTVIEPEEELRVFCNSDRFEMAIQHLVQNAQEATKDDGKVVLELRREGDFAVLRIQDDGVGMDEGFLRKRLFNPFDSTKGLTGMGIGAYEARETILSLGGALEVTSAPGKGTLFVARIPLFKE